ncbi:MAG: BatA domain-containing protein [Gemmatimonadota bacterium]
MTFLAPLMLLAGVALAIPIFLHLFRRRSESVQAFPALRYLKRTTRERARIVRLRQLLLLALRLAVIALVVLAGARIVLPLGGGDQPPAGTALIIDNGIASARVVDGREILDHLKERALAALDRAGSDDRIWVIPAGEPWKSVFPVAPDQARTLVSTLEATGVTPELDRAVSRAASLLQAGAPPLRTILLISEFEGRSLPAEPRVRIDASIPLLVTGSGTSPSPNRGFGEVQIAGGLAPRAGTVAEAVVRIVGDPVAEQEVRLRLDGNVVAAARTTAEGSARLDIPSLETGWVTGQLEIDPDELRLDDVHHLALAIRPAPRVRLDPSPPHPLAIAAEVLHDRGRISLRIEPDQGAPGEDDPLLAPAGEAPVGIETEGRTIPGIRPTLVFAPADPAALPRTNQRLRELVAGWRFQAAPSEVGATTVEAAVEPFGLLAGLQVRQRYLLLPDDVQEERRMRILARLPDGSAWIGFIPPTPDSESPGLVLVASPLVPEASQLPESAAIIPFLSAAIEVLAGGTATLTLRAGDPFPLPPEAQEVQGPEGTRWTVSGRAWFAETGVPGVYTVVDAADRVLRRIAINPLESMDMRSALNPAAAAERLGANAIAVDAARDWSRAVAQQRRGREAWRPLLLGALLLLLLEGWLSRGGNGRKAAPGRSPANHRSNAQKVR